MNDIHEAARSGDLNSVQQLVECSIRVANIRASAIGICDHLTFESPVEGTLLSPEHIDAALLISATWGHLHVVQYLIEDAGADIHACDDLALRMAACYNELVVVKYLVEHGADLHINNEFALQCSAERGHVLVVQYLVEHGADVHADGNRALRRSARYGHLPVVKYLVEHGADVHACNDNALHRSAGNGHLPVVQYLVEDAGADINAWDDLALRQSAHCERWSVVQYLVNHGADIGHIFWVVVSNRNQRRVWRMFCPEIMQRKAPPRMERWHAYYRSLVCAFHKVMGRRTAMDVHHLVVEMLVGKPAMTYFRQKARVPIS